ncbi:MAG: A/G-specific adenine glycosylase [Proteobacteria bacterium]|nr:MAG: A/G-specific adenine glycosylase [Pseudomonadota bacterium]
MTNLFSVPCKPLLQWYQTNLRDLPWRHTTDPYHIWVSEMMLQQTQVKTVLPRYEQWFQLFPNIQHVAAVPLDDVLKAWEGLGYYRRARFIHSAAQQIMDQHDGIFPEQFDDILSLSGIGQSTAGAIASFCFGMNTPVLDGNVKRVLKRWHNQYEATDKQLWVLAQEAIDASNAPAIWNQAMMELGATLCQARSARCDTCPVSRYCKSAFSNIEQQPSNKKKTPVKDVFWQINLHTHLEKGLWLQQRPEKGIWAGLWTPPIIELPNKPDCSPCHIHLLTHRRLHLYSKPLSSAPPSDGKWVKQISQLALPTGIHRLLEKNFPKNKYQIIKA